jgi:hypothetical protein
VEILRDLDDATSICTQSEDTISRLKPFKYPYEKVMYVFNFMVGPFISDLGMHTSKSLITSSFPGSMSKRNHSPGGKLEKKLLKLLRNCDVCTLPCTLTSYVTRRSRT